MRHFRHYKGGEYRLLCRANHTETGEILAVYKDSEGQVWARPYGMFFGYAVVDGKKVKRFREIT